MKIIIIQGSARSDGHTHQIVRILQEKLACEIIDLKPQDIHSFSYQYEHTDDDFLPIMRKIVEYDLIIFATPVYWYAMSGIMKNFFDRLTDCLKIEKTLGRKLRGKSMAALACGSDAIETEGFFVPFKNTAGYLGMSYLGDAHTWIENKSPEEDVLARIEEFAHRLKAVDLL